jgi:hypothetical protein
MDGDEWVWYNLKRPDNRGLAAPIERILRELAAVSLLKKGEDTA